TVKHESTELPAAPTFLERMVEKLGVHARSASAYSEPISKDGVTIVPVAKIRWGFGGGGGAKDGTERGGGGGGGMRITPVGYIEVKDGRSEFKPIRDAASYVPMIIAGGAAGFFLLRALRKLLR
ncbi:MAG TPA: spore germination protein GerW family protein, partial [Pirellulales bacterium]